MILDNYIESILNFFNEHFIEIILALIFALVLGVPSALLSDYLLKSKRALRKFIEFNKKSNNIIPLDFRIAKYKSYYYKKNEYGLLLEEFKKNNKVIITGKPKSGKTRTAYELLKTKENFKVVKFREKLIELDQIPVKIFKGRIIVFIDDLNKYVKNLDLYELIRKLEEESKEFFILATCRSGYEYKLVEREFQDIILEFKEIKLDDINENEAKIISKSQNLSLEGFDGTIGSLILGSKDMEIRYNGIQEECKFLFSTLKLLNNAGIFITNQKNLKLFNLRRLKKERINSQMSFESTLKELEDNSFVFNDNSDQIRIWHESYFNFSKYETSIADLRWLKEILIELEDIYGLFNLGAMFYIKKSFNNSIECYNEILKINPKFIDAWNSKGLILSELNKNQDAIKCYDSALKINPEDVNVLNSKGVSLRRLNKPKDAIKCYDKALKFNPKFELSWYNKGLAYFDLEKYHDAIDCYNKALEINPNIAEIWNNKGNAFKALNKPSDALKFFNIALKINPTLYEALYNKGDVFILLGEYEKALEYIDKVLDINPNLEDKWFQRGIALEDLKNFPEAVKSYDKALKLNPKNSNVWSRKGSLFGIHGKYDKSLKFFDKALEIDPNNPEFLSLKGTTLGKLEKHEEALKFFDKALEIDPNYSPALQNKLVGIQKIDDNAKALKYANELVDNYPDLSQAYSCKGVILGRIGENEKSLEFFDKAIKLNPENFEALTFKGFHLAMKGEKEEAKKCATKVLKSDPNNMLALVIMEKISDK